MNFAARRLISGKVVQILGLLRADLNEHLPVIATRRFPANGCCFQQEFPHIPRCQFQRKYSDDKYVKMVHFYHVNFANVLFNSNN
jgi:hypothetical protein